MMAHGKEKSGREEPVSRNVILLGLPGCGKSRIGRQLAYFLRYGFLDLDQWIATTVGKPVHEILTAQGEAAFRGYEAQAIADMGPIMHHVVALGGGALQDRANQQRIAALGTTVWLQVLPAVIARRLLRDAAALQQRPLLAQDLPPGEASVRCEQVLKSRLESLLEERRAAFAQADIWYDDSFATEDEAALCIRKMLSHMGASNPAG